MVGQLVPCVRACSCSCVAAGSGNRTAAVARQRVVSCHAIAAAERPTKQTGPIIMDGQVLHSITHERLELVKTLGPYLETQVSGMVTMLTMQRQRQEQRTKPNHRHVGATLAEGAQQMLATLRFPSRVQRS